jgi:hypothetical protein
MPGGPFMGILVDAEPDGQPNPTASGDDTSNLKDEDGVTLQSALVPGGSATFDIDMKASPVGCLLSAWIDFDGDGAWTPPIEKLFTDVPLPAGGIVTLSSSMPPSPPAVIGRTYARFRCSTVGGLPSFGPAPDGEVEDLLVEIMAPPKPPEVTIAILSATTLQLSWPQVTQDIHGNSRLANGYRIYRDTSPYFTPGSPWVSQWGPGLPNPVTKDAADLGDPVTHHFYIVRAVNMDIMGYTLESVDSVRTGEFEFVLVPGSP